MASKIVERVKDNIKAKLPTVYGEKMQLWEIHM